jgi:hypothetical protein
MRIFFISLFLILFLDDASYADIFSKDSTSPYTIDSAISEDKSGFYYRGGIDYRPTVPPDEPQVGYSILSGSKGCSGFDLASSFNSVLSEQILADYLKGVSSEAMAAAPMLLLEYVSPTLADVIKHFNTMTNMRLGLRYAQCEDIENAAGEYMDKLRKKSESECVKEKVSAGLDIDNALKACKEGKDPFAFLKNAEGITLGQGGKIDVISDIFKKINIPNERKDFVISVIGETTITASQIENNKGEKSIYKVNEEFRSGAYDKLLSLASEYYNSKTVSSDSLKELSLSNNPITEEQIKDITLMPKAKQYIAVSKISSDIAYFKTISKYRQAMDDLLEAIRTPGLDDVQRSVLERDYNYLKEKLERFKEERGIYRDYNETVAGILTESEREKLSVLMNGDQTGNYFYDDTEAQNAKEMYLPVTNDEKQE